MCDKAFNIVENQKYCGYQRGLTSMFYKFFIKKASGSGLNKELDEDSHKPVIRKFIKKGTIIFYTQYLWCWACWYGINK